MTAFDPMELLTGADVTLPLAGEGQPPVVKVNLDRIAGDAGELGRDDVLAGSLVQIDGRFPPAMSGCESIQPLLNGQQVANRIPAREGHESDATPANSQLPTTGARPTPGG